MKHFNNNGLSLVEVMIGVGITSVMALAMGSMISNFSSQLKLQEDKLNVMSSKNEVLQMVQSRSACTGLLQGSTVRNGSPLSIGPFSTGARIGNRTEVNNVVVSNVTRLGATGNNYSANIEVRFVDMNNSNIIYKPLEFVLYYTTAAGTLDTCGGGGTVADLEASCLSIGASWNTSTNSCDIDNAVCSSLGGTLEADGSCSGIADAPPPATPSPTMASCDFTFRPRSESDDTSRYFRNPKSLSECRVQSTTHGMVVAGDCQQASGRNRVRGSCSYQCSDGTWMKISNTCHATFR